jgi:hypothetical protein
LGKDVWGGRGDGGRFVEVNIHGLQERWVTCKSDRRNRRHESIANYYIIVREFNQSNVWVRSDRMGGTTVCDNGAMHSRLRDDLRHSRGGARRRGRGGSRVAAGVWPCDCAKARERPRPRRPSLHQAHRHRHCHKDQSSSRPPIQKPVTPLSNAPPPKPLSYPDQKNSFHHSTIPPSSPSLHQSTTN